MSAIDEVVEIEKTIDLWASVLEQAADDFLALVRAETRNPEGKFDISGVRRWLFKEDSLRVGSFMWACNVVRVDPFGFRNRLLVKSRGA